MQSPTEMAHQSGIHEPTFALAAVVTAECSIERGRKSARGGKGAVAPFCPPITTTLHAQQQRERKDEQRKRPSEQHMRLEAELS